MQEHDFQEYELLCAIVNYDLASKVIKSAKQLGVMGGTIFLGKGTVKNHILKLLDLYETRREIAIMMAEKSVSHKVLEELNKKYSFHKPNHGIAFSISVCGILGTRHCKCVNRMNKEGEEAPMYQAIFVIVDKGNAEAAIEAAVAAGSRGGTIINARGSGVHETEKLFHMEIEPEKEIVLILSESQLTDDIAVSIKEKLKMDEPGNGIIFIQNVEKTYGIY